MIILLHCTHILIYYVLLLVLNVVFHLVSGCLCLLALCLVDFCCPINLLTAIVVSGYFWFFRLDVCLGYVFVTYILSVFV